MGRWNIHDGNLRMSNRVNDIGATGLFQHQVCDFNTTDVFLASIYAKIMGSKFTWQFYIHGIFTNDLFKNVLNMVTNDTSFVTKSVYDNVVTMANEFNEMQIMYGDIGDNTNMILLKPLLINSSFSRGLRLLDSTAINLIIKTRDYIYGTCQYTVLSIKTYLRKKSFWRKNNRQYLGNV